MSNYDALMKRCSAGTMNYEAANGLHADCYGAIGRLLHALRKTKEWVEQGSVCPLCYSRTDRCEPHRDECIFAEIGGDDG
jgi:hypothetical protein